MRKGEVRRKERYEGRRGMSKGEVLGPGFFFSDFLQRNQERRAALVGTEVEQTIPLTGAARDALWP